MKRSLFFIFVFVSLISCMDSSHSTGLKVENYEELQKAIETAQAGDEIVLANGSWKDVQIQFIGKGTKDKPIVLRAETAGMVFLEGQSSLKFGGEYLVVSGLSFNNGYTPSNAVIEFRINNDTIANHCRVTDCVIKDFTQPTRFKIDHWVEFWGRNNQLDHCYIAGKFNQGPTIVVNLSGNEHIKNYHQIINNHFGPKPRKGGPSGETIRIGNSFTSMAPSYVNVSNNFFEKCNGEVEIISSKSNFNEFRNNIFYESEGSLVMRHGNYCIVDGNFFIGNDKPFMGGIRVINTGHWITNNYFYKIKGEEFRSPLAIMNGVPKSPLNRYNQVTDVVVAHNTFIDCKSPLQLSVGANMSKKDILPAQEIRSARPLRTLIANNIIYNTQGDKNPIVNYDKVDGVTFKNNVIDNHNMDFDTYKGIEVKDLAMEKISEGLYIPLKKHENELDVVYAGFGFEDINKDIFGNSRLENNLIGAITKDVETGKLIVDKKNYGASWYTDKKQNDVPKTIAVSPTDEIARKMAQANPGDVLELSGGIYNITSTLIVDKNITLRSKDKEAQLIFSGNKDTPVFQLNAYGNLTLNGIVLKGEKEQYAFATKENYMPGVYDLSVENCEISNFKYVLKAYRGSFADSISFSDTALKNCDNGIELAAETNNKGDYNAEFVSVSNCEFDQIQENVIDFYRGGYDESTIGGNLIVHNNTFNNCGSKEKNGTLLNTTGIVNVDISKNTFQNNPVELIALLWGEKNNKHSENTIYRSGEIKVEQNLKQKLMY